MVMFTDPLRKRPEFGAEDAEWLHLLVGDWQLAADLAFADIVLWFPDETGEYVALAHTRPSTAYTVFHDDIVGEKLDEAILPFVERAWRTQNIERTAAKCAQAPTIIHVDAIPVVRQGRTVAVMTSYLDVSASRLPSRLELTYRQSAFDLLRMSTMGLWPDVSSQASSRGGAPRVGDGFIRLNAEGIVHYSSPNGVSAFRRLSGIESLEGHALTSIVTDILPDQGQVDEGLYQLVAGRQGGCVELRARGATIAVRTVPVCDTSSRFGAIVLCRDVSELRRREQELVAKDTIIREIHHRVKNNLQTVAALLRMQSRRMKSAEGRSGLEQAMRRVSAIALVHQTLSHELSQNVNFDEVIGAQFRLAAEVASPSQQVQTVLKGKFGHLPSNVATSLALVINELVSNAVEHGLHDRAGTVTLCAHRTATQEGQDVLTVTVEDDGVGMPSLSFGEHPGSGASGDRSGPAAQEGLGMQIVRTFVSSELGGSIEWLAAASGGTRARVEVPLPRP